MFNQLWIRIKYWLMALFGKRKRHNGWQDGQAQNQDVVNLLYMEQFMQNHR